MSRPIHLHIAAAPAPESALALFGADGEFAVAWRGLAARGIVVPMPLMLELYCYEFLERLREVAERELQGPVHAPFDPLAAFAAGDVVAHPGDVLLAMCPPLQTTWQTSDPSQVAAQARALFGRVPFDPERYPARLAERAASQGWQSP